MKLQLIADMCDLSIAGNGNIEITSIAYANDAQKNDIAVAFSMKDIENTKAMAVLSEPCVCFSEKTMIYCIYGKILSVLTRVAELFVREGIFIDYNKVPEYEEKQNGIMFGNNVQVGKKTIIGPFVTIGDNVIIGKNCIIEPNVFIGSGTQIGDYCVIHSGARIGAASFLHYEEGGKVKCFWGVGRTVLESAVQIGYNAVVQRGTLSDTVIGKRTLIGNLVVIAHDVRIKKDSRIVCQVGIAGGASIGEHVKILGQSGVANNVHVGNYATVLAKSVATKNVEDGEKISGVYGREHKAEMKAQALLRKLKQE